MRSFVPQTAHRKETASAAEDAALQLQNLPVQRRLQLRFESRLPIQPEFIQHAPFYPVPS